jgi:hypothetical protein
MLVVRPVRHILRGAFLDRSGDKYSMTLWRYLKPLYEGPEGLGYGNRIHQSLCYVYEPYFQPLLLDVLREDVFSDLGQLTSMEDLARYPAERYESHGPPIVELVLAGERQHATALVDEIERTKSEDATGAIGPKPSGLSSHARSKMSAASSMPRKRGRPKH